MTGSVTRIPRPNVAQRIVRGWGKSGRVCRNQIRMSPGTIAEENIKSGCNTASPVLSQRRATSCYAGKRRHLDFVHATTLPLLFGLKPER